MDGKDRERLMLSTGIALVGYAIIFLLLMGLKWPPVAPFRTIATPVSVYVSLQGSALTNVAAAQAAPQSPPAPPKSTATKPPKPSVTVPPKPAVTTPTPAEAKTPAAQSTAASPVTPAATAQSSSPSGQKAAAPAPVASEATAIPSRPNIPQSITSSAGPSAPGSSSSQAAANGGAPQSAGSASATPGVTYPPSSESSSAPPQGGGGTGTLQNQGQSKTYYGPTATSNGSFFNPDLAAAAGSTSTSNGGQGGTTSSGQAQGAAGGAPAATAGGTGTGNGGSGTGSGSQAPSSSGPKIDWKSPASARKVAYEPPPLVIPRQYLDEIPPSISLKITFQVTALGSVEALNVTPSTGYPGLDNLLEKWMQEWTFEPVAGNQVAQGTLPYVIQATTAR